MLDSALREMPVNEESRVPRFIREQSESELSKIRGAFFDLLDRLKVRTAPLEKITRHCWERDVWSQDELEMLLLWGGGCMARVAKALEPYRVNRPGPRLAYSNPNLRERAA